MSIAIDDVRATVSEIPTFWRLLIPSKVNVFIWRIRKSFVPCYLHLAMRCISLPSVCCPICKSHFEDVNHAIIQCSMAAAVWKSILSWCGLLDLFLWEIDDFFSHEVLEKVSSSARPVLQAIFCTMAWVIWKSRNKVVKEQKLWCVLESISKVHILTYLWLSTRKKGTVGSWVDWFLCPLSGLK